MHKRTIQRRKAREYQFQKYEDKYGFSPKECWNLDRTIIEFILPRLKYLTEHHCGYPCRYEDEKLYTQDLKAIVYGFELYLEDDYWSYSNPKREEETEAVNKAFDLFAELFRDLWD